MTRDEILQALRMLAMGRIHPEHERLAEALAAVFLKDSCDICVMPGGKHFGPCPNNPDAVIPSDEQVQTAKRRKKAD